MPSGEIFVLKACGVIFGLLRRFLIEWCSSRPCSDLLVRLSFYRLGLRLSDSRGGLLANGPAPSIAKKKNTVEASIRPNVAVAVASSLRIYAISDVMQFVCCVCILCSCHEVCPRHPPCLALAFPPHELWSAGLRFPDS